MNAPAKTFRPLRRVRWEVRVCTPVGSAAWSSVTASSEDRAAVMGLIFAESFHPGVVREVARVDVRREGVTTHWAVSCEGEGYAAYCLDEEDADAEDTHDAEDCGRSTDAVSPC